MNRACRAVLVDLSGTLHVEDKVIPGAVEALERLRDSNLKIRFVTNTTKESKNCLFRRLTSLGFAIEEHEIFTSLTAARDLLQKRDLCPLLMIDDLALDDFIGIKRDNPNAVVVGLAPSMFNYENMNIAFRLILEQKSPLIAIHKGRRYKRKDGLALGPGPFVAALEYSSGIKAEVVGKPSAKFFHSSLQGLGCDPSEVVMVGDDVRDDISGAQNIGMAGILVKTGKYRPGDENIIKVPPSYVCESFPEAVDQILKNLE